MSRLLIGGLAALGLAAALSLASPARATVMVEVPLEEMAQQADAIVFGVVERSGTQTIVGDGHGLTIHTVTTIRVLDWVGGDREAPYVTVRELGGVAQGRGMWAAGTPVYRPGDLVVVFLETHPMRADEYRTYAMSQGRFAVMPGAPGTPTSVRRDLDGIAFASWDDAGRMEVEDAQAEPSMHFETFVDYVRRMRRQGGGR